MYLSTLQKLAFATADRTDEWAEAGGARIKRALKSIDLNSEDGCCVMDSRCLLSNYVVGNPP